MADLQERRPPPRQPQGQHSYDLQTRLQNTDSQQGPSHDIARERMSQDSDYRLVASQINPENHDRLVHDSPGEPFCLGYFDVFSLVVNRMIGTGIFNSPSLVKMATRSTGTSLLLWLAGCIYCLAGTHVYIEYGLNVPRYFIANGQHAPQVEQSVPRSGGDLNYLQYRYSRPAYRKNTFMLSTCIFGFGFIAFGNMASNCINFAVRVLKAGGAGAEPDHATTRGVALGVAIITCFIHALSRRGGIWLSNLLAIIKVIILLLIIITAIVVGAGGLPQTPDVIQQNLDPTYAFGSDSSKDGNNYSHAFLAIIFAFSGFEQPNYVLGEISKPRRRFPIAITSGVVTVVLLYMAVNISYMVVVPSDSHINGEGGIAQAFFSLTFARLSPNSNLVPRFVNAVLAISSLGNIIVMTYTSARVKQEIAKEGILPYPKFFAQNTDVSIGRGLKWLQTNRIMSFSWGWFKPEDHMEETPIGAFCLHLTACFILIFATWGVTPESAYSLLSNLTAYMINCFFGFFLSLGILTLRFRKPPITPRDGEEHPDDQKTWTDMTGPGISPILSTASALVYMVGSIWPLIGAWSPPSVFNYGYGWWVLPVVAWSVVGFATLWFLGFLLLARTRKRHEVFEVVKTVRFDDGDSAEVGGTDVVLIGETVDISWTGKENFKNRRGPRVLER